MEEGSFTAQVLHRPSLLVRDGEALPKAALRLSLRDAQRMAITEDELLQLSFSVRIRHDGPLAHAMAMDPWWQGKGCGQAKFTPDHRVTFTWPADPDPEAEDGAVLDPFAAMGLGKVK